LSVVLGATARFSFVHHHVVADEAHIGAALDHAVGDAAAGDVADLETLKISRIVALPSGLTDGRRQRPDIAAFTSSAGCR
jgi:hypothetical protein